MCQFRGANSMGGRRREWQDIPSVQAGDVPFTGSPIFFPTLDTTSWPESLPFAAEYPVDNDEESGVGCWASL
jgi:hypothetical protein